MPVIGSTLATAAAALPALPALPALRALASWLAGVMSRARNDERGATAGYRSDHQVVLADVSATVVTS